MVPANSAEVLLLLGSCLQPSGRVSPQNAIPVKTRKIKCNKANCKEALLSPLSVTLMMWRLFLGCGNLHTRAAPVFSLLPKVAHGSEIFLEFNIFSGTSLTPLPVSVLRY